jgi:hypothetical protein
MKTLESTSSEVNDELSESLDNTPSEAPPDPEQDRWIIHCDKAYNPNTGEVRALTEDERADWDSRELEWLEEDRPKDWKPTHRYVFKPNPSRIEITPLECEPPKEAVEELRNASNSSAKGFDYRGDMVFDAASKGYWVKDPSGKWIPANETQARRRIKIEYKPTDDKNWSADSYLDEIHMSQNVAFSGSISGYRIGKHNICGKNVLITDEANFISPAPSREWPTIQWFLGYLFIKNKEEETARNDRNQVTQIDYFLSWLHVAVRSLYLDEKRPGQAIALAGPRGCGKSFCQNHIITPILGGRVANPYLTMVGETRFNNDLYSAEHLIIDDQNPHTDIRARRNFGTAIKRFTVNEVSRMEEKFKNVIMADPFWRLTISLNDNEDDLLILPPMEVSLEDKIMLFKVGQWKGVNSDFGTATLEGRKKFADNIRKELPGFLAYLMYEHKIPSELVSPRFGVKEYHHPDILCALSKASPEAHLLELIDTVRSRFFGTNGKTPWTGQAKDADAILRDKNSSVRDDAAKLLTSHQKIGSYFRKLAEQNHARVKSKTDSHTKVNTYTIQPPRD